MAVYLNLVKKGYWSDKCSIDSEEASLEDLKLCHGEKYINQVFRCGTDKKKDVELSHRQN